MTPLNELMARGKRAISPRVVAMMQQQAVELLMGAQNADGSWPLVTTASFAVDERQRKLSITITARGTEQQCVAAYGSALSMMLATGAGSTTRLQRIASDCVTGRITTLQQLHRALERRVISTVFTILIVVLLLSLLVLWLLNSGAVR